MRESTTLHSCRFEVIYRSNILLHLLLTIFTKNSFMFNLSGKIVKWVCPVFTRCHFMTKINFAKWKNVTDKSCHICFKQYFILRPVFIIVRTLKKRLRWFDQVFYWAKWGWKNTNTEQSRSHSIAFWICVASKTSFHKFTKVRCCFEGSRQCILSSEKTTPWQIPNENVWPGKLLPINVTKDLFSVKQIIV